MSGSNTAIPLGVIQNHTPKICSYLPQPSPLHSFDGWHQHIFTTTSLHSHSCISETRWAEQRPWSREGLFLGAARWILAKTSIENAFMPNRFISLFAVLQMSMNVCCWCSRAPCFVSVAHTLMISLASTFGVLLWQTLSVKRFIKACDLTCLVFMLVGFN